MNHVLCCCSSLRHRASEFISIAKMALKLDSMTRMAFGMIRRSNSKKRFSTLEPRHVAVGGAAKLATQCEKETPRPTQIN